MCIYSINAYRRKYDPSGKLWKFAWYRWSLGHIGKNTKRNWRKRQSLGGEEAAYVMEEGVIFPESNEKLLKILIGRAVG